MAIRILLAGVLAVGGPLWWFSPAHEAGARSVSVAPSHVQGREEFTVSNMQNRAACLITRSDMTTLRSRGVMAGSDCAGVWPGLSAVRNWTENGDGTIDLTDDAGEMILTLGLGDGVAYESLEPSDASIALTAVN